MLVNRPSGTDVEWGGVEPFYVHVKATARIRTNIATVNVFLEVNR